MAKFYFTMDDEDGHIRQNADIDTIEAATVEEAFEKAAHMYYGGYDDIKVTGFDEGFFGDCWIKLYREPSDDEEFDGILVSDMYLARPGTHPGGNAYWLTINPVYVLELEQEEE